VGRVPGVGVGRDHGAGVGVGVPVDGGVDDGAGRRVRRAARAGPAARPTCSRARAPTCSPPPHALGGPYARPHMTPNPMCY
jgi:hypothetical protein